MYNFYQYEKAIRAQTLQNEPMMASIASSAASPKSTLMGSKMRSKSYMSGKQDVKHSSVEVRRKSEIPQPTHTRSPHEKREKLVESYKSRVANFIKDVSTIELLERGI